MPEIILDNFEKLCKLFNIYDKLYHNNAYGQTSKSKIRTEICNCVEKKADSLYGQVLNLGKKLGEKRSQLGINATELRKRVHKIGKIKENIDIEKEEKFGKSLYFNKNYIEPILGDKLTKYLFNI